MTSGQRALVAAWLQFGNELPAEIAGAWADACAWLVEDEWTTAARGLLRRMTTSLGADRAWSVLAGTLPPSVDELADRRALRALEGLELGADDLPWWAEIGTWSGPAGEGPRLFGRHVVQVDAASVDVVQVQPGQAAVVLEAGAGGAPVRLDSDQARAVASGLTEAAEVVDQVRQVES